MREQSSSGKLQHTQEKLIARAERCVCKHCGGKLTTSLVIYDIYGGVGVELYCPACEKNDIGIEAEIYALAQYFVENFGFNYFGDMAENTLNKRLNIAKIADVMSWLLKNLALLNQEGLQERSADYQYIQQRH